MPASDWEDLCVQTIVWEAKATRDQYGKPDSYDDPITFAGRRVFEQKRITSHEKSIGQGAEMLSTSHLWILGTPDIGYEDRVYVQDDTAFPPILSVERYPDENGDLFVKVFFGSANG